MDKKKNLLDSDPARPGFAICATAASVLVLHLVTAAAAYPPCTEVEQCAPTMGSTVSDVIIACSGQGPRHYFVKAGVGSADGTDEHSGKPHDPDHHENDPNRSVALTGQAMTLSQGTLAPGISALLGQPSYSCETLFAQDNI